MKKYKLIICVYACVSKGKYKLQIETIKKTWGLHNNDNIKILYFLESQKKLDFITDEYIYLPNVNDDYISASYKQELGLKYIHENYNTEFILSCGTDTYINIPKLLFFLDNNDFNINENLYIGGHGCNRQIEGINYYFHSGGPGFILTSKCLGNLYPFLNNMTDNWVQICETNNLNLNLKGACDVAISYNLQKNISDLKIIKFDLSFFHCNYKGYPCHINNIQINNIICCHLMSIQDFYDYEILLKKNNYYL